MPSHAIFADTNLLLYVLDADAPAKQARAAAWHERLWREGIGRTSAQVISEFYVNLKRAAGKRMTAEEAWTRAARYLAWKPRSIDDEVLNAAREIERRYRISWWDGLIVAAAQLQGCALLLTEDLQDGMSFGGVTARSPFTLAVEQAPAPYAVPPMLARLHRPRGRPRRAPQAGTRS
ncbi:MAG TPA: PIN domain-containing protein [Burkholderiales bacterium]|jgi:predicted nucleic acid-binding protein|nr:PIN domain-containing protein [Burkholderiales bacterium]